jgi:hypothetical protein
VKCFGANCSTGGAKNDLISAVLNSGTAI